MSSRVFDFGPGFGTYTSVSLLGKGAFSVGVYRVKSTTDPSLVRAVKCVNIAAMKAEDAKAARNEVTLMSQLSHPHIVRFYSSYEDKKEGLLNILLQYADGGDATALLDEKRVKFLDEAVIGRIFAELCSALVYLHSRRVLHRDLKLQNIFLIKNKPGTSSSPAPYTVLLGDFGISRVLQESALAKTHCGTPYYFCPELCLSKPYNNKSDVWSMGVLLYEIAAQRRAFDAQNIKALMAKICRCKYDPVPPQYHRSLQQLIDGMLQVNPGKRLSARAVAMSEFVRRHCDGVYGMATAPVPPSSSHSSPSSVPAPSSLRKDYEYEREVRQRQMNGGGSGGGGAVSPGKAIAAAAAQDYIKRKGVERLVSGAYEPMKYVKRRVEIMDYDNQQQYVARGHGVVQGQNDAHERRATQHEQRTSRIADLRKKLQEIESRHTAIRYERDSKRAEWLHQQEQQQPAPAESSLLGPPRAEPSAADLRAFYNNRNRGQAGVAPWARDDSPTAKQLAVLGKPIAPSSVRVDSEFQGRRELLQGADLVDEILARGGNSRKNTDDDDDSGGGGGDDAQRARQLWELQKQRIAAARELEDLVSVQNSSPTTQQQQQQQQEQHRGSAAAVGTWKKPRVPKSQQQALGRMKQPKPHQNVENPDWDPNDDDDDDDGESFSDEDDDEPSDVRPRGELLFNPDFDDDDDDLPPQQTENGPFLSNEEDDDDFFEDEPARPDVISKATTMIAKFRLDGKTLHLPGVTESSPLGCRVEALRQFLDDGLGSATFKEIYGRLRSVETLADIDEAERQMKQLQSDLGPDSAKLLDLMIQLRVCEEQI